MGGASGRQRGFWVHGRVPLVGGAAGVGVRPAAEPRGHEGGHVQREQTTSEITRVLTWSVDLIPWRDSVNGILV